MKKSAVFFLVSLLLLSCSNNPAATSDSQTDEQNTPENLTVDTNNNEEIGKNYIISGILKNKYWYVAKVATYTQTFRFTDDKIYYRLTRSDSNIGSSKEGNIEYLNQDLSEFEYRWDGSISGSEKRDKILVLDNDILIVSGGFDCSNSSANTNICYNNLDTYTNEIPFMGFGKLSASGQWIVFTPSKKCYKRYKNLDKNEFLIKSGTWEKTDNNAYKIYWTSNNPNKYDILSGTLLYQNAGEDSSTVPISLTITDH